MVDVFLDAEFSWTKVKPIIVLSGMSTTLRQVVLTTTDAVRPRLVGLLVRLMNDKETLRLFKSEELRSSLATSSGQEPTSAASTKSSRC